MSIEEIINNLTYFNENFPKESLLEARNNKEEIAEIAKKRPNSS